MFNRLTSIHEAGHAVVCKAVLGEFGTVRVNEGGGGWAETPGITLLGPEERAALALAGAVGEHVGDRLAAVRAVAAILDDPSGRFANDAEWLNAALDAMPGVGPYAHSRTRREAALRCAVWAQQAIERDAATFHALRERLQADGIATGRPVARTETPPKRAMPPTPPRGRYLTAAELRAQAAQLRAGGYTTGAELMERSAANMERETRGLPPALVREVRYTEGGRVVAAKVGGVA